MPETAIKAANGLQDLVANSEVANAKPIANEKKNSERYRDKDKRREYMRAYMVKYRAEKKGAA